MTDGLIDVLHARGMYACYEVAFRVTHRPAVGEAATSKMVRLLDGTTPEPGSAVFCGACGVADGIEAFVPDGGFA